MANFSDRPHFLCFIGATNDKFLTNQGAGNTSFIHKHQLLRAFFKIQISYQSSSPSGFYNITTGGDTWKTYCNMGRIPGCGEGGWTLVMRINGSKVCYKINGRLDVLSACLAV